MVRILFELAATLAVVLYLGLTARSGGGILSRRWSVFDRIGRKPRLAVLTVSVAALAIAASASLVQRPVPSVHDEFSYLLAADTFARGRVTNPTHPLWRHFETFHVIHRPTYASKYPPGNGLVLAIGQVVFGHPVVGVWVTTALAAGAVCWMLYAWVPGRWAVAGGLIVASHPFVQFEWSQSYWGGMLAVAAGALMFGGVLRVNRTPRVSHAVMLGLGVVILANTRPYEGLLASLPAAFLVVRRMVMRGGDDRRRFLGKVVVPVSLLLAVAGTAMGYYNFRVTGDPWTFPYAVHERQYAISPLFLWESKQDPPDYRHAAMRSFYNGWALYWYDAQQDWRGFIGTKSTILVSLWLEFVGLGLTLPAGAALIRPPTARARFGTVVLLLCVAGSCLVPWLQPHYLAPIVPLMILLIVEGLRKCGTWNRENGRIGRRFAHALLLLFVASAAVQFVNHTQKSRDGWQWQRVRLTERLKDTPGRDLVVVRYDRSHDPHREWVYNRADIDASEVVWAREMDPQSNRKLLDYFDDRRVWLLKADASPPRLIPHTTGNSGTSAGNPAITNSDSPTPQTPKLRQRPEPDSPSP